MYTIKDEVAEFVKWFFDTDNAKRSDLETVFPSGKRFVSRCLSLSQAEKCPEFTANVERLLRDLLGPRGTVSSEYSANPLDRAWSLYVLDPEKVVWYVVVVSALLPIITVRATTDRVGEGPDSHWVLPPAETELFYEVKTNVQHLVDQIAPVALSHGYSHINWDDEAFQQTVMFKYCTGRWSQVTAIPIKTWDLLIYFDYEHG